MSDLDINMSSSTPQNIDFPRVRQHFSALAAEFDKVEHLPAFDHGAAIITRLDQLQASMHTMQASMDTRFNQLQASTDARFNQLQASTDTRFNQLQASLNQIEQRLAVT
jgi:hypothetical protein